MFKYGDHIMGIQGHPEYTKDILLHLIDRLLQHNYIVVIQRLAWSPDEPLASKLSNLESYYLIFYFANVQESYADKLKSKVDTCEPDREAWKKLCTSFLKRKLWEKIGVAM